MRISISFLIYSAVLATDNQTNVAPGQPVAPVHQVPPMPPPGRPLVRTVASGVPPPAATAHQADVAAGNAIAQPAFPPHLQQ
jgi:hypothetical protein